MSLFLDVRLLVVHVLPEPTMNMLPGPLAANSSQCSQRLPELHRPNLGLLPDLALLQGLGLRWRMHLGLGLPDAPDETR